MMIVVTIIGILAAITIPAYTGYITQSKVNTLVSNQSVALPVVKNEAAKMVAGGVCTDIITRLNSGNKRAIANNGSPAFVINATSAAGQVGLTGLTAVGCRINHRRCGRGDRHAGGGLPRWGLTHLNLIHLNKPK